MTITEFIFNMNNLIYNDLLSRMIKDDPNTWFLPPNYSIRKIVNKTLGTFSYSYHDNRADITVSVSLDLFATIKAAHKDYQETLLIHKLNKEANPVK